MQLRSYQEDFLQRLPGLWSGGYPSVVCVAPVGSGKTVIGTAGIARIRAKNLGQCWWLAHSTELIDQPADDLRGLGVPYAFVKSGRAQDPGCPVQISQVQSMVTRPIQPTHDRAFIVVDEAHKMRADTYTLLRLRLQEAYAKVYFLLLTATPYRLDGRGLRDVANALVEVTTPRQLIELGAIENPVFYASPADQADSSQGVVIFGDPVKTWLDRACGAPTVVRCRNRAHSKLMVERFSKHIKVEHLDGDTPAPERVRALARLSLGGAHPQGLHMVCVGGPLIEEGFDSRKSYLLGALSDQSLWVNGNPPPYVPLACLIDLAPTHSRGAFIQRIGRISRKHGPGEVYRMARASWSLPGGRSGTGLPSLPKSRSVALIHSGNLDRHGFFVEHEGFDLYADRTGVRQGQKGVVRATPVTCRRCLAIHPGGTPLCAACGAVLTREGPPPREDASVQLVERHPDPQKPKLPPDPTLMESQLRAAYAEHRARMARRQETGEPAPHIGAVAHKFRALFGYWPPQELDRAVRRSMGLC